MLDRYNRLPYNYQSKTGYDSLIQYVLLREILSTMVTTITDLDVELKMRISLIECLESKNKHYWKVLNFIWKNVIFVYLK